MKIETQFFKGPITSCEYITDDHVLIGYGPYLTLINDTTYEEITQCLALQYRVIHKIIKFKSNQICVFGQKAFKLYKLDQDFKFKQLSDLIELNDWIFDIYWLNETHLIIVCAHNQFILFNLNDTKIEKQIYCSQKCMLYSAKIIDLKQSNNLNDIIIASGTIYNQILLWNPLDGMIYSCLSGHQGVIFNIDYSNQTNTLFSVSDDRSINVWKLSLNDAKLITRFYGHDARVWKCTNFIDPITQIEYLISIGEDLNCCLWNLNEKNLLHRFNSIKKGSKNIWSLCVNMSKLSVITGWADGGIRKFELKNYIRKKNQSDQLAQIENLNKFDYINIKNENTKDYIRNVLILDEKLVCCTHLGSLYLIETKLNSTRTCLLNEIGNEKLILKSTDLASYNVMTSIKINPTKWCLTLGTITGSIYLILISSNSIEINQIECITNKSNYQISNNSNSFKICNLIWFETNGRKYLVSCFSFLNGLIHLYELLDEKLILINRLELPETKHRWLTCFTLVLNYLICGDKCGNFYLFKLSNHLNEDLIKPIEFVRNLTKQNAPISAIYNKKLTDLNYVIICCCKDGWYRLFELNLIEDQNETDYELKLINKYQINSFIDLIESFIFNTDLSTNQNDFDFNLENSLVLAACFYGDKFLLWNFYLNRALFEFKCGGANRSWDYAFYDSQTSDSVLFRFVSVSNKSICETSKLISKNELIKPDNQIRNHMFQLFHGNMITTCRFFNDYLLTGSEDTQLIISRLNSQQISHVYHLQGHDSVIKCIRLSRINNSNDYLLVSAGGKANIKIWKLILNDLNEIKKIEHLYEFKRIRPKKEDSDDKPKIKPWLYTDLKSNPDIRFMDLEIINNEKNDFILCFFCSDGQIRLFNYNLITNRLNLTNKYEYPKCYLSARQLKLNNELYLLCCGTDGCLQIWNLISNEEIKLKENIPNVHQSGINCIDLWQIDDDSALIATVGDDTSLSIVEFNSNDYSLVNREMTHASALASVKFLNETYLLTVAKDQRLALWKYEHKKINLIRIIFINVADVSSMDVYKIKHNVFKVAIVGVGLEIIDLTLE